MHPGSAAITIAQERLNRVRRRQTTLLEVVGVIAIVVVAAILRFADLSARGLIYWDEAKFALEGIRIESLIGSALGAHLFPLAGKAIGTAKPTSALLYALADALLGQHDWSPLYLNAVLSVGQVLVLYLALRRLFGGSAAIVAALFLAVSEYEIIYARSALTESDGSLILLIAVAAYAWQGLDGEIPRRRRFWSALLLGLAFTTNYRLIVYAFALGVFDLAIQLRREGAVAAVRAAGTWAAGFLVIPAAWQAVDFVMRLEGTVLFRSEMTGRPMWYLQQAVYQIHQGKQSRIEFMPQVYLQWLVLRQGVLAFALLLAGIVAAGLRRARPSLLLVAMTVIPWGIYTFAPFVVPRNLEAALPFMAALEACALVGLVRQLPRFRAAILLLAAVVLAAVGSSMSWRLTAERSGFAAAAVFVERHDGGRALTTNEIMVFYLRGSGSVCEAPPLGVTLPALSREVAAGYHYGVLDHHVGDVSEYVVAHSRLLARYAAEGHLNVGESLINSENTWPPGQGPKGETVRVYGLTGLKLPKPDSRPVICNRNKAT